MNGMRFQESKFPRFQSFKIPNFQTPNFPNLRTHASQKNMILGLRDFKKTMFFKTICFLYIFSKSREDQGAKRK